MKKKSIFLLTLSAAFFLSAIAYADIIYLSTQGSDNSPGTKQEPFATLQHSLDKLKPGDTLYVREGTYFEHSIVTSLKGTAEAPILITSYPGEQATFDAGIPNYRKIPNEEWELVDPAKQIYKTKQKHKGGFPATWLIDYGVRLMTYKRFHELQSDTCRTKHYIGPGLGEKNGYYYIRLTQCPKDLIDIDGNQTIDPIPPDPDPRNVRIAISNAIFILQLKGAEYVKIKNIDFVHATNMVDWSREADGRFHCGYHPFIFSKGNIDICKGSHHITIHNSKIVFGNVGITANDCSNLDIQSCHIYQGFPDWNTWRDVKGDANQPWPEFNSFAFSGVLINSDFQYNNIHHTMDGLYIKNGSSNSRIRWNYFWMTRDDAVNFETYVDGLDVGWNMLRHVFEGFSIVGYPYANGANGGINGDVFIHHNVIDVTKYTRRTRQPSKENAWECGKVWGSHSCVDWAGQNCDSNRINFGVGGDCKKGWTAYNNTIIAQARFLKNQNLYPTGCKHFINNIIYCTDTLTYKGCSYCDGNIFWRAKGTSLNPDPNGLTFDPGFDMEAILSSVYDSQKVWDFYIPSNEKVFTPGVPYGSNWPDTKNVDYRGAIPTAGVHWNDK